MTRICSSVSVFAVVSLALMFTSFASPAVGDDQDASVKLSLTSGYGYQVFWHNARTLHLTATLDHPRGGSGMLSLDPNQKEFNQFGDMVTSTDMAIREIPVTFELAKGADQPKDGRRLYEIKGHGLDRLFLVVPAKGGTSYRLIRADKDGKNLAVILLERK